MVTAASDDTEELSAEPATFDGIIAEPAFTEGLVAEPAFSAESIAQPTITEMPPPPATPVSACCGASLDW